MQPPRPDVTRLLHEWSAGRREAFDELFPLLYNELRRLATSHLRKERGGHTLRATALVNEAYLKLVHQDGIRCENRAHFFAVAARAMRCLLVDHARARQAAKRGGGARAVQTELAGLTAAPDVDLVALDEALGRLAKADPRQGQLVELRFFGGLTIEELARVLAISPATVSREWATAKAWLYAELHGLHP
jgi:RNA polymerase sigma factor (TIGR02999 family)